MFQRFRQYIVVAAAGLTVFISAAGALLPTSSAQAQVSIVADAPRNVSEVLDQVYEGIKAGILGAVSKVVAYGLRKVAYDTAVYVASGGKGQGALAHTKSFGDYMSDVGDQAFGQAIEELGKPFGLNLCKIPDIKVDLALRVGLRTDFLNGASDPTVKPNCSFQEFSKNWLNGDAWQSQYGGDKLAQDFNASLKLDNNDFGIQLSAKEKIGNKVYQQQQGDLLQRLEGQGFIPKTGLIAGNIQTPAGLIQEGFKSITPDKQQKSDEQLVHDLITQGNIRVVPNVLSIFLSTLASTMVTNYQQYGILPFGAGCTAGNPNCLGGTGTGSYTSQGMTFGRSAAQQFFQSFLETPAVTEDNNFDVVGRLASCDGNGVYNCRADEKFVDALNKAKTGAPISIGEALKQGLLHGDWKLIPPTRVADNANQSLCQRSYCYSNVVVLRQLRIVPLGFQIAAQNSDPDNPWTLQQVVDGFEQCSRDSGGNIVYDAINRPFCHLIDPDWILKLPATKCSAEAYGNLLLSSGVGDRTQDCVDIQSCVDFAADGTCRNYGYCTQEKNSWKFGNADSCTNQAYASCRSYSINGQTVSYLYRTLDTGFCSENTVGCRAYSLTQENGSWKAPAPVRGNDGYTQTGIYFNNKLSSVCSANSAGCSAFTVATTTAAGQTKYLKKAPDYLGCYGDTSNGNWPTTQADLTRINPPAACSAYAAACIPDEQSCNWYTNAYTGDRLPGRYTPATIVNNSIKWNDECAAQCVGYDAYQELPSTYTGGQPVVYLTPPNSYNKITDVRSCNVDKSGNEVGCSSFTNLGTTQNGVEKVEYYSFLRACMHPDQNPGATFVTYEGSTSGGYQLRSYTLVADGAGGPAYFAKDPTELNRLNSICSEVLYKAGQADSDCRQFSDAKGNVYYRILASTIPVSKECTPYRLNDNEMYLASGINSQPSCENDFHGRWDTSIPQAPVCRLCYQNGTYDARQGSCVYYGLPAGSAVAAGRSSIACSAAANTCRAYKGNTGNNTKTVFADNFESSSTTLALSGWGHPTLVSISGESTQIGGHSLLYKSPGGTSKTVSLDFGSSYEISFWAKGKTGTITVSLLDAASGAKKDFGTVSISSEWLPYRLGPIDLAGFVSSTATVVFMNTPGGNLYLDNITLRQFDKDSVLYLVKNTIKVDALCDADQTDNLPGEALGCMAYKRESDGKNVYLTGFTNLCREGAIGCTALFETHNTPESGAHAYNVRLFARGGQTAAGVVGGDTYSCEVKPGNTSCYVEIKNHAAADIIAALGADAITTSTVYIAPDTPKEEPIYLVANQAAVCSQADVGCVLAGMETKTPFGTTYVTTTIKNNPGDQNYAGMLCQSEAVGCGAFGTGSNSAYFKDPAVTGQKVCTYKSGVTKNGASYSGWFWQGVGVCANNAGIQCTSASAAADCGLEGATCTAIDEQPCYPAYLINGNEYGLYSYGDKNTYNGFVGSCPATDNMCRQFIDHSDVRDGVPKSFYLIDNGKLSEGDCSGAVNQKTGCILLDQADNPNKYWPTQALYDQSAKQGTAVPAVSDTVAANNDANRIVKVTPDRVCSAWLQCRSFHRVWDDKKGAYRQVCDDIGRCDAVITDPSKGEVGSCANWIDGKANVSNQIMTPLMYVNQRDVSWNGEDYSGFTLLNTYPVEELTEVNINTNIASKPADWRLVKRIACAGVNCKPGHTNADSACNSNGDLCGSGNRGTCIDGYCSVAINGSQNFVDSTVSPTTLCRAYPEKDSPFPNLPSLNGGAQSNQNYSGVHYCGERTLDNNDTKIPYACECSYTKVSYGDTLTKYWNYDKPNNTLVVPGSYSGIVPPGICRGGSRDGAACSSDANCYKTDSQGAVVIDPNTKAPVTDGNCQIKKNETKFRGWQGYCLEYDMSRTVNGDEKQHPCLTWMPVDNLQGYQDISSQHAEAGFQGTAQYCVKANLFVALDQPQPYAAPLGDPKFIGAYQIGGAPNTYVGCEVMASVDPLHTVAWTNRVWQSPNADNQFTVQSILAPNRLDYRFGTDLIAFGSTMNPLAIAARRPQLVTVPWCKGPNGTVDYTMPINNWDVNSQTNKLTCDAGATLQPVNADGQNVVEGRSYNAWRFGSQAGKCYSDSECNAGVYCQNLTIKKPCGSDLDCGQGDVCETMSDYAEVDENLRVHLPNGSVQNLAAFFPRFKVGACRDARLAVPPACQQQNPYAGTGDGCTMKMDELPTIKLSLPCNPNDPNGQCYVCVVQPGGSCARVSNVTSDFTLMSALDSQMEADHHFYTPSNPASICKGGQRDGQACTNVAGCYGTNLCLINHGTICLAPNYPPGCTNFNQVFNQGGGTCTNNQPGIGVSQQILGENLSSGIARARELFAKVETGLRWDIGSSGNYARYVPATFVNTQDPNDVRKLGSWDFTEVGDDQNDNVVEKITGALPPHVTSVRNCASGNVNCEEGSEDSISVQILGTKNIISSGSVLLSGNAKGLLVNFFAYANADHMPLRQIVVDWGDDTQTKSAGSFRNNRGSSRAVCETTVESPNSKVCADQRVSDTPGKRHALVGQIIECSTSADCPVIPWCQSSGQAQNFGSIIGQTCDAGYFQFFHGYQCLKDGPGWRAGNDDACVSRGLTGGCCVFTPRVQVKDNWGYYNGVCPGRVGGDSCYDKVGGVDEAIFTYAQNVTGPWTPYGGQVIVAP